MTWAIPILVHSCSSHHRMFKHTTELSMSHRHNIVYSTAADPTWQQILDPDVTVTLSTCHLPSVYWVILWAWWVQRCKISSSTTNLAWLQILDPHRVMWHTESCHFEHWSSSISGSDSKCDQFLISPTWAWPRYFQSSRWSSARLPKCLW